MAEKDSRIELIVLKYRTMNKYLRHMIVFSRIVEAGSISAAAVDLDISKSVVSDQLKALEKELGVKLLKRTTRQQMLTPVGSEFYDHCRKVDEITREAWESARSSRAEPSGPIKISTPHALIDSIISPAVGEMVSRYTDLVPTILANDSHVNPIEKGVDLAIRVGEIPSSDYKQRLLGRFRKVLCASPRYIKQKNLSSGKLVKHPELLLECDYVANAWEGKNINYTLYHDSSNRSVDVVFRANRFNDSVNSVIAMIKAGAGIALIPEFLFYPYQQRLELESIFSGYSMPHLPVYSIHAYGKNPPPNVTVCIDFIKRQMQQKMVA